jgi:hypothetical protein
MVLFVTGKRRYAFFWLSWLFMPKEKIALNDFPRIAAFFGVAFNMLTFLRVEPYSPISASVIW